MDKSIKLAGAAIQGRNGKIQIKIIGVGGAGGNAVDHMAAALENLSPAESAEKDGKAAAKHPQHSDAADNPYLLAAINTDAQSLDKCRAAEKLQIGTKITFGLGAGGDPQVGRAAAESSLEELRGFVKGADIVVVTAGMGGGTGSGASPLVAKLAREQGALTLAVVALPFDFEGNRRRQQATDALELLRGEADAVIAVPNDRLFKLVDGQASVQDAFQRANGILLQAVMAVGHLVSRTGLINLDFADLKAVLKRNRAQTHFGFGEGTGKKKTAQALDTLLSSPLLENGKQLENAEDILVSIVGGKELTYADVQETMSQLARHVSERAHLIVGADVDDSFGDRACITVISSSGWAKAQSYGRRTAKTWSHAPSAVSLAKNGGNTDLHCGKAVQPDAGRREALDKASEPTVEAAASLSEATSVTMSSGISGVSDAPESQKEEDASAHPTRISAGETGSVATPVPMERSSGQPRSHGRVPMQPAPRVRLGGGTGIPEARQEGTTTTEHGAAKPQQTTLPLELESKGKFRKSEPTVYGGEDLDIPTFLRQGVKL